MPPAFETNLATVKRNLDSMHQEAKRILNKLIESSRRESELHQENESLRQQNTGLQARLKQAEKDTDAIQEQLTNLGDLRMKNDNLTRELNDAHRLIWQLEEELQEDESKIESIESMLSPRRKRPRSSGQIRNYNESDTEIYNPPKHNRQDSSFDEKLQGRSRTSYSAPVHRRDSAQAQSGMSTRKPMNIPRQVYGGSVANFPTGTRDCSSSGTPDSNSPQNSHWTTPNGVANGHCHRDSGGHESVTSNKLNSPPGTISGTGESIRGRAIDSKGPRDNRTHAGIWNRGEIICHTCWEHRQNCYTEPGQVACGSCLKEKIPCTRALCLDWHDSKKCFRGSKCHNVHDEKGFNVIKTQLASRPKIVLREENYR